MSVEVGCMVIVEEAKTVGDGRTVTVGELFWGGSFVSGRGRSSLNFPHPEQIKKEISPDNISFFLIDTRLSKPECICNIFTIAKPDF